MNLKNLIYAIACLSFSIVIGAAVYEHMAVVPQWSAAPPLSLHMFQGPYALNPTPFWKSIHPVTLLLLVTCILLHWQTERRKSLLIITVGYIIVLIATFTVFVPELVAITGTAFSETVDPFLAARAKLWERMSLVRLSFLIILAIIGFMGLTKQSDKPQ